jgi:hypothetical protein
VQLAIDILFVVGALVSLVKAAELLLRPHQEKWLQEKFEWLALWLDYTRPLRAYQRSRKHVYVGLFYTGPFVLGCFVVARMYKHGHYPLWGVVAVVAIVGWIVIRLTIMTVEEEDETADLLGLRPPFDVIQYWIARAKGFGSQLIKHGLLGGISVGLWCLWLFLESRTDTTLEIILVFGVMLVFLSYTAWVGGSNLAITIVSVSLLMLEGGLTIVRAIVWRIVEYNKGAFAAIVLIMTLALGVTEFFLKYQRPGVSPVTPTHRSPSRAGTSPSPSALP